MLNKEQNKPSLIQNILNRVGNPLEWHFVDKVLLLLVLQTSTYGFVWIVTGLAILIPFNIPKYMISTYAVDIFRREAILLILYGVFTLLVIYQRRRSPDNKWSAYCLAFIMSAHGFVFLASMGYMTNPHTFLIIFAQAFIGLLLFNITFASIIFGTWGLLLTIRIWGELFGTLRYAPYLANPPFMDGKIDGLWLFWNLMGGIFIITWLFVLGAYTINRWQKREAQVTELSELLKKMFGRYLSTEVMSSLIENPSLLELGGERKEVTIVMTDLRGFTALSERLKPEQVIQMLNAYFEVMVETVLKHKGTINEIIGDALLVIFGAPQEMPDQVDRAIACSIEMQNAMTEVNRENRSQNLPDLEMGIGINKAEVIVGNIGSSKRSKYTVVGNGVNMTSRIESYTVGGQILISDSVFKKAGKKLRIDGEQEVYPKGSETPLKIYEVGGIADQYHLVLEAEDTKLVTLQKQIPVQYSFLGGKHIREEHLNGNMVGLSKKSAEVVFDVSADLLTNLKISLTSAGDELSTKDIYGKIIDKTDQDTYLIRFTSVPPEISSFFHAFRLHALKDVLT